jgi:putative flavoprotein involved in K+ transport
LVRAVSRDRASIDVLRGTTGWERAMNEMNDGNGEGRFESVIIGGGQAGLSVGYHLQRRGRPFVILDANERIGDSWRRHWDSLRLYSPAGADSLPGWRFPAPAWSFPSKDEMADYLETYATRFELPVRTGVRVRALSREGDRFVLTTGAGRIEADNVVVASGTWGVPHVPDFAGRLDPGILQLHSSEYRNPSQLREGGVLVVGASHSGGDIAFEVAREHPTVLAGRDTGQIPFRIEGRVSRVLWPVIGFLGAHVLTLRTPIGRKLRPEIRLHGGPLLRVKASDLQAAGVERVFERVVGVQGGLPELGGGRVVEVTNVIWCTGFRHDFRWIDLPIVGGDGYPQEKRGVVASAPGLYFAGLPFQYAFTSMLVAGAGRDGGYVAKHIASHRSNRRTEGRVPVGA